MKNQITQMRHNGTILTMNNLRSVLIQSTGYNWRLLTLLLRMFT